MPGTKSTYNVLWLMAYHKKVVKLWFLPIIYFTGTFRKSKFSKANSIGAKAALCGKVLRMSA